MKKIFDKIIRLFSIDISSKHVFDALQQTENVIVLHRHKIFLLKAIFFQFLGCLLMSIYLRIIINYAILSFTYIMTALALLLFLYRIYISFILYKKHLIKRKTFYIGKEVKELYNVDFFKKYIVNALFVGLLIILDMFITIIFQISMNGFDTIVGWIYVIEIVIFILLIVIILKTVKIQLDFEMDQIIFSPGSLKLIDREGFYKTESKIYIGSQIQTIEIIQSGWIDSVLKIGTLSISTSTAGVNNTPRIFDFGKINYSEVIENKLSTVIYS